MRSAYGGDEGVAAVDVAMDDVALVQEVERQQHLIGDDGNGRLIQARTAAIKNVTAHDSA